MASLYEIDSEIMNCIDPETGEILDFERLEHLQMERQTKIENVALWVKNLKADMSAYKVEKDVFAEREKQTKRKIESLSQWLTVALDGQRVSTNRVAISFRKSESVEIVEDEKIPGEYIKIKMEKQPDKVAIKEAIKNGETVPGCKLVSKNNIQIK